MFSPFRFFFFGLSTFQPHVCSCSSRLIGHGSPPPGPLYPPLAPPGMCPKGFLCLFPFRKNGTLPPPKVRIYRADFRRFFPLPRCPPPSAPKKKTATQIPHFPSLGSESARGLPFAFLSAQEILDSCSLPPLSFCFFLVSC